MTTLCLTSYGYRLVETAPKALASLMGGKHQPDRIILYIAEKDRQFVSDQFKRLPVEIRIVPDYMSHKKFYGLTDRSLDDDFIVIVDDDLHYKEYFWDKLWQKYEQHKGESPFIVCNRAQLISGNVYRKTPFVMKDDPDCGKFRFGSGSGLLIPPRTMRISKETLAKGFEIAPHCDETFYSCYCIANHITTYSTGKPQLFYQIPLPKKDPRGLWEKFNKDEKDSVLVRCKAHFGITDEQIFVSFTSWKKRIGYASKVVERMKRQTLPPTKIILTLSSDEFPQREGELPTELLAMRDSQFEIRWVKEDTKTFKKLEPLFYIHPEHWVLIIDDDIPYDDKFIETMFDSVKGNNPVTGSHLKTYYRQYGSILSCAGAYCLIKPLHCLPYLKEMEEYLRSKGIYDATSDPLVTYSVLLNGYKFIPSRVNYYPLARKSNLPAPYSGGKEGRQRSEDTHAIIRRYIKGLK